MRRGQKTMSAGRVRSHLYALSNLYRRAQEEELVPLGYNPASVLMEKPARDNREARWLKVPEAALLLERARRLRPRPNNPDELAAAIAEPLLATFLLTGGRMSEVLGLELDDVSFDRRTVTFRPNAWRRLKTAGSWRIVPLWPQLEAILYASVFGPRLERGGRFLFPLTEPGPEAMLVETRKLLDRLAAPAGLKKGEIRHRVFRHTYCAARLETTDRGAPVSTYIVSRELGHGSEEMVRQVYAHLDTFRHRSEVVEYRVEQHFEQLADRLRRLGFVTPNDTRTADGFENETPHASVSDGEAESLNEWARRDSNARPLAPEASALSS